MLDKSFVRNDNKGLNRKYYLTLFVVVFALISYFAPKSKRLDDINSKSKYGNLKSVYLTIEDKKSDKCLVTDRYATTLRRSDEADDVRTSWCYYSEDKSIVVQRKKKKSLLLIPFENFSQEDLAQVHELNLEWIVLYIDRLESGKYLKISFPEDSWSEHKRNKKIRRTIGFYGEKKIFALDTLLRPRERFEIENVSKNQNFVIMKIVGEEDRLLPSIVMRSIEKIDFKDYILKNFYQEVK